MFKKVQLSHLIITTTIIGFNIIIIKYPYLIIESTKNALLLWFNRVIPSLYPFIILNNILKEVNGFYYLGKLFSPLTKLLFKHKENGGVAFVSGITSGYPLGGIVTADLLNSNLITLKEANYLIMFTNNAGPLFVIGTIGVTMFNNKKIGYYLLAIHIISAIILGVILSFFKEKNYILQKKRTYNNKSLSDIISESVHNSNSTILLIGGFIMFYSIVISILDVTGILLSLVNIICQYTLLNELQAYSAICGFFEMTTGINYLASKSSNLQMDLTIISGILAFGGLSIHGQTLSKVSKTKIKIRNYFFGKILHTILSMFLAYNLFVFLKK